MNIRTNPPGQGGEPTCPDCGAEMILRKPKPGQHWGPFWSCIDYPDCQGICDILPDGMPAEDGWEADDFGDGEWLDDETASVAGEAVTMWHAGIPESYRDNITRGDLLRLLLTLPDECVDAVVTDPPYSSGGMFRGDRTQTSSRNKYQNTETMKTYPNFSGDSRDQRGYHYWLALWLAECWRVAKPGAPICIFTDWRQLPITTDAIQAGGWIWRGINVWDKTEAARPQKGRYRAQCEYIVWGSKGAWWDNEQAGISAPGALRLAANSSKKKHITAKPIEVMRWLLSICPPGGIVLDPCIGSGTTGQAALEMGMHFIGFELNPDYEIIAGSSTETYQMGLQVEMAKMALPVAGED